MSFKDYSQQAYDWLNDDIVPSVRLVIVRGVATGGSTTTVVDSTKSFEAALYVNKVVKVTVEGVDYYCTITVCSGSTLTFAAIAKAVTASCPYEILG
jgi:uncharacterized protein YqfB (UPF0267 family)